MKTGKKAQGQDVNAKLVVQRHGHAKPRSYNRCEKAAETKVRHSARREIREQLS
ncbi:MAG TPA: hypothetical protein VIE65_12500 [Methylobacter sp.]|jgi:hypothetical protein